MKYFTSVRRKLGEEDVDHTKDERTNSALNIEGGTVYQG
jgi:hypothetical protein